MDVGSHDRGQRTTEPQVVCAQNLSYSEGGGRPKERKRVAPSSLSRDQYEAALCEDEQQGIDMAMDLDPVGHTARSDLEEGDTVSICICICICI